MSRLRRAWEIIDKYGKPKDSWPNVEFPDPSTITNEKERDYLIQTIAIYETRKCVFDDYFDDIAISNLKYDPKLEIENLTSDPNMSINVDLKARNLSVSELHRWIDRCITPKADGFIHGYAGLIPYYHIEPYIRTKDFNDTGLSGVWAEFFRENPDIREMVYQQYLYGEVGSVQIKAPRGCDIYKDIIRMCKKKNLYDKYPLNRKTDKNPHPGRRSLYTYLKHLSESCYDLFAQTHLTQEAAALSKIAGKGQKWNPLPEDVYSILEVDEHKFDGKFIVLKKTVEGDVFEEVVDNLTLISGIDVNTKAIVGYHIIPGSHATAEDIQRCIINCIVPHKLMTFSIPGFKYASEECFPSLVSKDLEWAVFNQIKFDNAASHKTVELKEKLTKALKCQVTWGPVRNPIARPAIEKSFDLFEKNFLHRMINTTGGKIDSPKRNNPEEQAQKYSINFNDAKQLVELAIAEYNLTPKTSTYNMSPIQALRSRLRSGHFPRVLPPDSRVEASTITRKVGVTVLGDKKQGRNPYVNYLYARYSSKILAKSKHLIEDKITLTLNIDDGRYAEAHDSKGVLIGTLIANGKWGVIPHSLDFRVELNGLRNEGEIDFTDEEDFVAVYHAYASKKNLYVMPTTNAFDEGLVDESTDTGNKVIPENINLSNSIAIIDLIQSTSTTSTENSRMSNNIRKLQNMGAFKDITQK